MINPARPQTVIAKPINETFHKNNLSKQSLNQYLEEYKLSDPNWPLTNTNTNSHLNNAKNCEFMRNLITPSELKRKSDLKK